MDLPCPLPTYKQKYWDNPDLIKHNISSQLPVTNHQDELRLVQRYLPPFLHFKTILIYVYIQGVQMKGRVPVLRCVSFWS